MIFWYLDDLVIGAGWVKFNGIELTKPELRKEKLKKASHILSFLVAFEYFHMGKTGLPFIYLFAGLMQLTAIYILSRRANK